MNTRRGKSCRGKKLKEFDSEEIIYARKITQPLALPLKGKNR